MKILKKLKTVHRLVMNKRVLENPYRKSNDELKSIFVHIPKCAGVSIQDTIFHEVIGHNKIIDYKEFDKKKFEKYFKFAIVRNPWDRVVSAFHFLNAGGLVINDAKWANQYLKQYNSFEEFVLALKNDQIRKDILKWQHFTPQYKYITINNKIAIDFVGRMENIENDFEFIINRLGIKKQLIKKNKSDHLHYKDYYNEETIAIIADIYEKDIKLLNYNF